MLFLPLFPYRLILEKQLFYIAYIFFIPLFPWFFKIFFNSLTIYCQTWCAVYWVSYLWFSEFSWIWIWYLLLFFGKFLVIMSSSISSALLSFSFPFLRLQIQCILDPLIISYSFWMLCLVSLYSFFFFSLCFSLSKFCCPFLKFTDISLDMSEADEPFKGMLYLILSI